jgi:hypothetical protein
MSVADDEFDPYDVLPDSIGLTDFSDVQEPSIKDFRTQLRVMRESILALYWGVQEIEDEDERIQFRKDVSTSLCLCLQNVDLYLTKSQDARRYEIDTLILLPLCYGQVGAVEIPLSEEGAYLILSWPVSGNKEVLECVIPPSRKYWRIKLRWKRLNTSNSQPTEFEYPDGK